MRDERTNFGRTAQACRHERCPACGDGKPLSQLHMPRDGAPSDDFNSRRRALARQSRRRRAARLRVVMALYPEEWRVAIQGGPDNGSPISGGVLDAA
jgi:hypothetical protein